MVLAAAMAGIVGAVRTDAEEEEEADEEASAPIAVATGLAVPMSPNWLGASVC